MENTNYNPKHKRQGKDKGFNSQLKTIFQYLQNHIATASMITEATGVPQKNICRYKSDLEKAGKLWEVEKRNAKQQASKRGILQRTLIIRLSLTN